MKAISTSSPSPSHDSVSWAEPTSCATADSCTVCDAMLMSKRTGELVCPSSDVRFTPATRCPTSMLTRVA